jgi:hypothetical protein
VPIPEENQAPTGPDRESLFKGWGPWVIAAAFNWPVKGPNLYVSASQTLARRRTAMSARNPARAWLRSAHSLNRVIVNLILLCETITIHDYIKAMLAAPSRIAC